VDGQVRLTVRPYQQSATREVPLTRQKIAFNPVSPQLCAGVSPSVVAGGPAGSGARGAQMPNPASPALNGNGAGSGSGKLGYIRVATFSKQTGEGVRAALEQLRAGGAER